MRIASFLPAATEILFALGLGDQLVGVTFECDYPEGALALPRVVHTCLPPGLTPAAIDDLVAATAAHGGSLYFADFELLRRLAPDLVLTQDLCHVCALDEPTLARDLGSLPGQPQVLTLSAGTLEGMFSQIAQVGVATGTTASASGLIDSLRKRVSAVAALPALASCPRVLALEWLDPFFQGGHWVPEMILLAGGKPVLAEPGERSIRLSWEQIRAADPDVIVAMPCGYNLEQTVEQLHNAALPEGWHDLRAIRNHQLFAVDGSAFFSRPGPRLVDGVEILAALLRGTPGAYLRLEPNSPCMHPGA